MEFSYRDGQAPSPICLPLARNNRGQGTIEFVLVLVVGVAIVMGGLYQLNTAFKSWANNYFGDYLACLLETGDLPTIGGSPGDGGVCDQLFKPFSFAEGRPLKSNAGEGGGDSAAGKGAQRDPSGNGGGAGRGGSGYGGSGRFTGGRGGTAGMTTRPKRRVSSSATNTGNTTASGYGYGSNYTQRGQRFRPKEKLDNKFAFDEARESQQKRRKIASTKKSDSSAFTKRGQKLPDIGSRGKKGSGPEADTGFSIGNFIKYIIVFCIILALLFFLGGQALSISKSME